MGFRTLINVVDMGRESEGDSETKDTEEDTESIGEDQEKD